MDEPDELDRELALCDQERAQQVAMLSEAGLTLAELVAYMRYGYGKLAS